MNFIFSLFIFVTLGNPSYGEEVSNSAELTRWPIVIDPGHGGQDKGAQSGNLKESDLVLQIALKLQNKLQNTSVQTFLTRGSDQSVDLAERLSLAEKNKAQLFVSIHANSNPFSSVRGAEFYFREHKLKNTEKDTADKNKALEASAFTLANIINDLTATTQALQSLSFSQTLKSAWLSTYNPPDKTHPSYEPAPAKETEFNKSNSFVAKKATIKTAPFYVLMNNKIPAVLIEVGYLSSPQDLTLLKTEEYRNEIAEKIKNSILKYQQSRTKIN